MEEFFTLIIDKWPDILSYTLNFAAYFLIILYKAKFNKTENTVTTLFKNKVTEIKDADAILRALIEKERQAMRDELTEAKQELIKTRKECQEYLDELHRIGAALKEIITEEVYDDTNR